MSPVLPVKGAADNSQMKASPSLCSRKRGIAPVPMVCPRAPRAVRPVQHAGSRSSWPSAVRSVRPSAILAAAAWPPATCFGDDRGGRNRARIESCPWRRNPDAIGPRSTPLLDAAKRATKSEPAGVDEMTDTPVAGGHRGTVYDPADRPRHCAARQRQDPPFAFVDKSSQPPVPPCWIWSVAGRWPNRCGWRLGPAGCLRWHRKALRQLLAGPEWPAGAAVRRRSALP